MLSAILEEVRATIRELLKAHAPAAANGDAHAMRVARAAATGLQIAELLARLPTPSHGDVRILRSKVRELGELLAGESGPAIVLSRLDDEIGALLGRHHAELERARVAWSLQRRAS